MRKIIRAIITSSPNVYAPLNVECKCIYDTKKNVIISAHRIDNGGGTYFSDYYAKNTKFTVME